MIVYLLFMFSGFAWAEEETGGEGDEGRGGAEEEGNTGLSLVNTPNTSLSLVNAYIILASHWSTILYSLLIGQYFKDKEEERLARERVKAQLEQDKLDKRVKFQVQVMSYL